MMDIRNDNNWHVIRSVNTLVAFYNRKTKQLVWPEKVNHLGNGFPIIDIGAGRFLKGKV